MFGTSKYTLSFTPLWPKVLYFTHEKRYRYSFNGQERDDEIAGAGNIMTAEFWEYDTRLGRRWNRDPVSYAWQSVYACFNNNPIYFIDPNGDEPTPDGKPINTNQSPTPWKVGMENSSLTIILKEAVINSSKIIRMNPIPLEMRLGMAIYKGVSWLGGRWGIMFTQSGGGGQVDNGETRKAKPNMVIDQLPIEPFWAIPEAMPGLINGSTKTIKPEAPRTPELRDKVLLALENRDKQPNDPIALSDKAANDAHGHRKFAYVTHYKYTSQGKAYYYRDSIDKDGYLIQSVSLDKKQYEKEK